MSKLKKALGQQKKQTEQVKQEVYGSLGIPLGGQRLVNVPNRQGYVYVKLRDNQNEVIQAFNNQVAASYDVPVVVVRTGNKYTVKGVNTERYQNNNYNITLICRRRRGGRDVGFLAPEHALASSPKPHNREHCRSC